MTSEQGTAGPGGEERRHLDRIVAVVSNLPHVAAIGVQVVALSPGRCELLLPYRAEHAGNVDSGILHGGIVTTVLDSAAGIAVFSQCAEGGSVATLDMRIDYLRPAVPGASLRAVAEVYRATRNVVFVSGRADQGDDERPVANCAASFMVGSVGFDPREAGAAGRG